MELTDIPGIGPTKAEALNSVGITTVQELAAVDLRKPLDVNIGKDVLRSAKQEARKVLRANGIPFETAPYNQTGKYASGTNGKARGRSAGRSAGRTTQTPAAKAAPTKKEQAIVSFENKKVDPPSKTEKTTKKKFLSRIFARN